MGTQRFDVGASASPAERAVKDSPVEFPLWPHVPAANGLFDPRHEKDSCGVGFIADIKGRKSHKIVEDAIDILCNLEHRGAVGADPRAGDGAGILVQIPHKFFVRKAEELDIHLPEPGHYAVGYVFMPHDPEWRKVILDIYAEKIPQEGLTLLGWREVPHDNSSLGESVKPTEPFHMQVFVGRGPNIKSEDEFERRLYILRKVISDVAYRKRERRLANYYVVSLSCRTIIYKGMFLADQLGKYYPDLHEPDFETALCLVHQRFSTNTFPSWPLAHPYRMVAHNGEINTLRGNVNWMAARQASVSSKAIGDDIKKLWPISYEGQSDTACFDNALEFLVQGGYSLAHAAMMLIPEAWAGNPLMDDERKAFYEYYAALMEPWDGPAAIAFTDGRQIGGTLDRNGLRPARWFVTKDDRVIMASEAGVLPIPESEIVQKWRLQPGKMLLVDLQEGRIISDEEIKAQLAKKHPYAKWLKKTQLVLEDLPGAAAAQALDQPLAARSPAVLRLHPGRPADPDGADGDDRPGSGRLDGHRHADLGALRQVEAALHLLQAELRAGDEPADRLDPRRTGDVAGVLHRAAAEPVRPRRAREEEAARSAPADPHQRRSRKDPLDRACRGAVRHQDARRDLSGRAGRGRHEARARERCASAPRPP